MFDEYVLSFDDKLFALVYNNKWFVKSDLAGIEYIINVVLEAPPYPGAKK